MSLDGFTDERILILNYTENLWRCAHRLYSSSICVFAHCDNLNLLKFMRFNANLNVAGWVNVDLFIKLNFLHFLRVLIANHSMHRLFYLSPILFL